MKTYHIKINVDDRYHQVEVSGNTPALLADEIKCVVNEFYEEKPQDISPDEAMKILDEKIALRKKNGSWEDTAAARFWKEYEEPDGRGNTPQDALEALEYEVAKLIEKYGSRSMRDKVLEKLLIDGEVCVDDKGKLAYVPPNSVVLCFGEHITFEDIVLEAFKNGMITFSEYIKATCHEPR